MQKLFQAGKRGAPWLILLVATPLFGGSSQITAPKPGQGLEKEFDWQREWGTIHINTLADGLHDPMIPATTDGQVMTPGDLVTDFARFQQLTPSIRPDLKLAGSCDVTSPSRCADNTAYVPRGSIAHGIKFDIKNSVINCMSKPTPTFAMNRGSFSGAQSYGNSNVCNVRGTAPMNYEKATIVFNPIWDPRANDELNENNGGPGCMQQVTNQCARDMHECRKAGSAPSGKLGNFAVTTEDGNGYKHPVTHFFSKQEVIDLCGSSAGCVLPTSYYVYQKIEKLGDRVENSNTAPKVAAVDLQTRETSCPEGEENCQSTTSYSYTPILKSRTALSVSDNPPNRVPGTGIDRISNERDPNLARIRTFRMENTDPQEDRSRFIITDPSDFFDLKLYAELEINGKKQRGKYYSGYNKIVNKQVVTLDTCPIKNITPGYTGICDPTNDPVLNAGCNLAIYQAGPKTTFTNEFGHEFTSEHLPVAWSGYMRSWQFITAEEFKKRVQSRIRNGRPIYAIGENELNDNPVLVLSRAKAFCEPLEMASVVDDSIEKSKLNLDLDCTHYLQYQQISTNKYAFMNLFQPEPDYQRVLVSYTKMQLYSRDAKGRPDPNKPVMLSIPQTGKPPKKEAIRFASLIALQDAKSGVTSDFVDARFPSKSQPLPIQVASFKPVANRTVTTAVVKGKTVITGMTGGDVRNVYGIQSPGEFLGLSKIELSPLKLSPQQLSGKIALTSVQTEQLNQLAQRLGSGIALEPGSETMVRMTKFAEKEITLANNQKKMVPDATKPLETLCKVVRYDPFPVLKPLVTEKEPMMVQVVKAAPAFIPTNSFDEFANFAARTTKTTSLIEAGSPTGAVSSSFLKSMITSRDCSAKYMRSTDADASKLIKEALPTKGTAAATTQSWFGTLSCKDTEPVGCNVTRMITANRYCRLEDDNLADCSLCKESGDPDLNLRLLDRAPASGRAGLNEVIVGGEILTNPTIVAVNQPIGGGTSRTKQNSCAFRAMCVSRSGTSCPQASTSGGHIFCFAAETRILMADGSELTIDKVRAGDEVLAFEAKFSKSGELKPTRVKATAVTQEQRVLKINALRVTPSHKMILESGRAVAAEELRVGDQILKADGSTEEVLTIENDPTPITVYNLVLEDNKGGYIANGMRVLSYPVLKGMDLQ